MAQIKSLTKKLLVIIITISLLISFVATPSAQAKLTLEEGEFYYSGTTKGTYKAKSSIFAWLLANIGDIADWLLGIITMGFRMVFVGWTALIEKILTWTLEGTTGVNVDGENVSATDLTSLTDSSNNVTVQAIVYNQVPALSVDFFDLEYDKTYSGTGKKLHCKKCDQDVEKCCTETGCSCKCKGNCDDCRRYIAALNVTGDPVIVQIKKVVATWYYVMRFLSAAAMLIVFLGVGIKMGLSTIASEKAVYKRMLVDWVVGAIIVFSIHYLMIFVVHLNNVLVTTVKDSAKELNKVSMMQLAEKSDEVIEYTNEELEIDIYEAVRTRAYDAKLVNGMIGMVMYMTLVYFAIRYTIVYLKRLLTLIVLTLMAPAVGVAYALQKVFSGKSSSLTTWMTEYIMNVLIQVIHAIIYSVFISTALIMSLQSVSGMILALILMNYALKAEKTFRTIFKMGGNGSLLDDTASAGDAEKIQQNFNTAKNIAMGAKPMANALMNSPYANVLKGAGKVGIAAGLGVARAGKAGVDAIGGAVKEHREATAGRRLEGEVDKEMRKMYGTEESYKNSQGQYTETDQEYEARRSKARDAVLARKNPSTKEADTDTVTLLRKGEKTLQQDIINAQKAVANKQPGADEQLKTAFANYAKFKKFGGGITQGQIAKAHAERLVTIENHFNIQRNAKGNMTFGSFNKGLINGVFGTKHYDYKSGKMVSDGNGLYRQLSASNLLGLTDADKKILKQEVLTPIAKGFGGTAALFIGMGTMVAHPKLGLSLAIAGGTNARSAFKKKIDPTSYNGNYTFARFSSPTVRKMQKEALRQSQAAWDGKVVENIKDNHPELYKNIREDLGLEGKFKGLIKDAASGGKLAVTVGTIGAIGGVAPQIVPLATVAGAGFVAKRLMGHTGFQQNLDAVNRHSAKQLREQQIEFMREGCNIQGQIASTTLQHNYSIESKKIIEEEMRKEGFVFDEQKEEWVDSKVADLVESAEKAKAEYDKAMVEMYAEQGMEYDPNTGMARAVKEEATQTTLEEADIRPEALAGDTKVNANTIKEIKKELDREIEFQLKTMQNFDINDASVQGNIIKKLTTKLADAKILAPNVSVEELFKEGSGKDFKSLLKSRAQAIQTNAKASETALTGMKPEVQQQVKDALFSITQESEPGKTISVQDVMSRMQQFDKGTDRSKVVPTSDGSQKVGGSDGSARVTTTDGSVATSASASRDGSIKLSTVDQVKIQEYIASIQSRDQARTVTEASDLSETRRNSVLRSAGKRKQKLDQVLSLNLDETQLDNITASVNNGQGITVGTGDNQVSFEQKDSQDILNLLFMRKELSAVNEFASNELKVKEGAKGYKKVLDAEKSAKVEYYKSKLSYEKAQQDGRPKNMTQERFERELSKRREMMDSNEAAWKEAKEDKIRKGPIIDIDSTISGITTTAVKGRAMAPSSVKKVQIFARSEVSQPKPERTGTVKETNSNDVISQMNANRPDKK